MLKQNLQIKLSQKLSPQQIQLMKMIQLSTLELEQKIESEIVRAIILKKGKRIDGMRFYEVDGKAFPSITTVLGAQPKPGLDQWRKNVGEEAAKWEMNRAARRGSATHTLVEQYLKGETPIPCGQCNQTDKFKDLFEFSKNEGQQKT